MSAATEITVREATYIDPRAGNDKFYRTFVWGSLWASQYGRNGTAGTFTKAVDAGSHEDALAAADKKFDSKIKKGYSPTRQGTVASAEPIGEDLSVLDVLAAGVGEDTTHQSEPVKAATVATTLDDATDTVVQELLAHDTAGHRPATAEDTNPTLPTRPMLASVVDASEIDFAMTDPNWCAQLKYDGDRVVIEVRDGVVTALNRQGQAKTRNVGVAHTTPFTALGRGRWVFDGEIVADTLVLFDLITATDGDKTWADENTGFADRHYVLGIIAQALGLDPNDIIVAPVADGLEAKADLLAQAVDCKREGIILRYNKGAYEPGRRSTYLIKHKLIKDADVVITALHPTKQSATLSVHDADGNLVTVGAASAIGKVGVEVGDVWVVTFLYVTDPAHPRMFQPRLVACRDDKTAQECTIDQFADAGTDKRLI